MSSMPMKQDVDDAIKRELNIVDKQQGDTMVSEHYGTIFHGKAEDMAKHFARKYDVSGDYGPGKVISRDLA